jgi:hypothetical protein
MEKRGGNRETGRFGVAQSMNFVQSSTKLVKELEIYLQDTHTTLNETSHELQAYG